MSGRPTLFSLTGQLWDAWTTKDIMAKMAKLERAYAHDRQRNRDYGFPRAVENEWSGSDLSIAR